MTGRDQPTGHPSRRSVLAGMALAGLGTSIAATPAGAAAAAPSIHPRSDWATAGATGPLADEAAGDVRFILVHHSETPNDYAASAVPRTLQGMYRYHTTDKGWNDIAYNFLVDAYGGIWEGRSGSLERPVKGDATGGSQGFAQLCCFVGNHTSTPPTQAAQDAMSALLAWVAGRYAINLSAGHTITFTSSGSNKWPAGTLVTTDPVAGHRDMSLTACPGDACYPLVRGALLSGAQARSGRPAAAPAPTTVAPAPAATPTTAAPAPAPAQTSAAVPPVDPSTAPGAATPSSPTSQASTAAASTGQTSGPGLRTVGTIAAATLGGIAVVGAGAGAVVAVRNRRSDREFFSDLHPGERTGGPAGADTPGDPSDTGPTDTAQPDPGSPGPGTPSDGDDPTPPGTFDLRP